jgi:hypothetical protein
MRGPALGVVGDVDHCFVQCCTSVSCRPLVNHDIGLSQGGMTGVRRLKVAHPGPGLFTDRLDRSTDLGPNRRRRAMFVLSIIVVLLASAAPSALATAPETDGRLVLHIQAPSAGRWTPPTLIDRYGGVSVSCPSSRFSMAVDQKGRALVYRGTRWSQPQSVDPLGGWLGSVSCPSASFCAAVDDNARVLTYNGSNWGAPQGIPGWARTRRGMSPIFLSVVCASASFCVVSELAGSVVSGTPAPAPSGTTTTTSVTTTTVASPTTSEAPTTLACLGMQASRVG